MRHFQHVILGTGQATGTLLGALLPTGDSIAVIEGDRVGGTCVNTGCTPTKALVASAKVAHMMRRAPEYGVQPNGVEIDFEAVRARMNAIRDNTGMATWIRSAESVSLFEDWGRFEGPRQIPKCPTEGHRVAGRARHHQRALDADHRILGPLPRGARRQARLTEHGCDGVDPCLHCCFLAVPNPAFLDTE